MVLFVGLAVGAVVTLSFGGGSAETAAGVAEASIPAPPAAVPVRPRPEAIAPRLAEAARQGRQVEIGVFGDSFGEGIWAGLYNQLQRDPRFEVHQLAERSTGFTRYRSLNVFDDVRAKLDRQPVDVAILSSGRMTPRASISTGAATRS